MTAGHELGRTRAQVLQLLQRSTRPMTVVEIADSMHLHKNSVRFHLDSLVELDFAERSKEYTGHQGRPHLVYLATENSPNMTDESLLDLCQVILRNFVMTLPDPRAQAEEAGFHWGVDRAVQRANAPTDTTAADDTAEPDEIDALAEMMASQGFASTREGDQLTFTRCPYKLAAVSDDDMVAICALHHGMAKGFMSTHSENSIAPGDILTGPGCTVAVQRS